MHQSPNAIIAWWAREAYGTTTINDAGRALSPEKRHEARSKMRRLRCLVGGVTVAMKLCFCGKTHVVAAQTVHHMAHAAREGRRAE
jgi:hypothetical protein